MLAASIAAMTAGCTPAALSLAKERTGAVGAVLPWKRADWPASVNA